MSKVDMYLGLLIHHISGKVGRGLGGGLMGLMSISCCDYWFSDARIQGHSQD